MIYHEFLYRKLPFLVSKTTPIPPGSLCLKLAAWGETARTETEDAQDGNEFG